MMWKGGPKALSVDINDDIVSIIENELWNEVDVDINIKAKSVNIQVNVSPDGSWVIVGVNGHPIDTTKRLVNV